MTLPTEIKQLIFNELIAIPEMSDELSSLALAWPAFLPLIRTHRFKKVKISTRNVNKLVACIDGVPAIAALILTFVISSSSIHEDVRFERLLSQATSMQELHLHWTPPLYLDAISSSLTALFLRYPSMDTTAELSWLLSRLPCLETLGLNDIKVYQLSGIARDIVRSMESCTSRYELELADWALVSIPSFGSFPNITTLILDTSSSCDAVFMDVLVATPTAFPGLEHFHFPAPYFTPEIHRRIQGFLRAYGSTLKGLYIGCQPRITPHGRSSRDIISLPPGLRVFEFQIPLSVYSSEETAVDVDAIIRYAKTLQNQSHSLRDIRINLIRFPEKPIDDKLLAALHLLDRALTSPSLELATLAFSMENPTQEKEWYVLDYGFPRVRRRYFEICNRGFWRSFPVCSLDV